MVEEGLDLIGRPTPPVFFETFNNGFPILVVAEEESVSVPMVNRRKELHAKNTVLQNAISVTQVTTEMKMAQNVLKIYANAPMAPLPKAFVVKLMNLTIVYNVIDIIVWQIFLPDVGPTSAVVLTVHQFLINVNMTAKHSVKNVIPAMI